ncbi:MAG: hypothetical protein ABIG95_01035 [Candidatus Woesearchaeota archaeon]
MGKDKHKSKILALFRRSPVVSFDSIQRVVGDKGYSKQLVRNMKIFPLAKGYYSSQENPQLFVFCMKPAYLGLQDAMSFHGLWEQETIPIVITGRKIRQGIRAIMGMNVLVRRINPKYVFGFDYLQSGDLYLPYSDIEKTFIDMVYFREPLSKEALDSFRAKIDITRLKSYLKKYPLRLAKRILEKVT